MDDPSEQSGEVHTGPAGGAIDPNNLRPPDVEPLVDATDYDAEYDDIGHYLGGGRLGGRFGDDGEDAEGELEGDPGDGERHFAGPRDDLGREILGYTPATLEDLVGSTGLRRPVDGRSTGGHPSNIREGGAGDSRRSALEDGARSVGRTVGSGAVAVDGPAGSRFRSLLVDGLNTPRVLDVDNASVTGRLFKISSIAGGGVSIVFHVNPEDADTALGFMHLRGQTIELGLTIP